MRKNRDYKLLAGRRFESANNDLKSAEVILREGGYYGTTCFLSQQIAEKYLKGYIIFNGKRPERIHKLLNLLRVCKKFDPSFKDIQDDVKILDNYYIEARYATIPIDYSKEEAGEALKLASEIMTFVSNRISN